MLILVKGGDLHNKMGSKVNNKTEMVELKILEKTLKKIDRLQAVVNAPSRSDAVRRSVDISEIILNGIVNGGKIILEDRIGNRSQVLITGLNA